MTKKTVETPAIASVPLPSADLIIYRFDQVDQKMEKFDKKLDSLTNNFVTKEEAQMLKEERDAALLAINKRIDNFMWYWRALIVAVLTALATAVVGLIQVGGK